MNEGEYSLGEMDRRLGNALRFGRVAQVDVATGQVKVDLGDLVTDWVPWTTPRAGNDRVWSTPDVGEQVVLVSPGDPSQGVVIGSLFQDSAPANGNQGKDRRITFADGTVVEFDRTGSVLNVQVNAAGSLRLNIGGTTLLLENGKATLTTPELRVASPQTTFTGDVTVQGSTAVQGITSRGKNISDTHTHTGVQSGPANTGAVT